MQKVRETPSADAFNASAEMAAKYPVSNVVPKKPRKSPPANYSVLGFEASGKVYCIGQLDKPATFNVVIVLPMIKVSGGNAPAYVIQVGFPRDEISNPVIRFDNLRYHYVVFKFRPGVYTVKDHNVTDKTEFDDLIADAPKRIQGKAKECMEQKKLYRVTL